MDWITFGSNLIDSTAGPLAIVIVVYWLKGHIKELLPFVRKVRYGDLEIDLDRAAEPKDEEKVDEKVEETLEKAKDTVGDVLMEEGIPQVNIETLRDKIGQVTRSAIQETREIEKDIETEGIRNSIIGLVRANRTVSRELLENAVTDLYDYPRSNVVSEITHLFRAGKIIFSEEHLLKKELFFTLPAD